MNIRILYIITFLLNIYLVLGDLTLEQQCNSIKRFMEDNKIPIPPRNETCCFNNKSSVVKTECKDNNVFNLNIVMKNNERTSLNLNNFPKQLKLNTLQFQNINFGNSLPEEVLTPTKTLYISYSDLKEFSLPSNYNVELLYIVNSNVEKVTSIPPSAKTVFLNGNQLTNIDVDILKNVLELVIINNPFNNPDLLFENITNKLTKLTLLTLKDEKIMKIPKSINNLSNLNLIDLRNNKIEVLPNELYEMKNLNTIYLNGNNIRVFGFTHEFKVCSLDEIYICTNGNNPCPEQEINFRNCTEEDLKTQKDLIEKYYGSNTQLEQEIEPFNDKDIPEKKEKSFFEKNKIILISIIIAIVLIISFVIFFCINKNNKQEPLFIKDDNNATYAYKIGENSNKIIKEFQMNNSENGNNKQTIETEANTSVNNVSFNISSPEMNNSIINTSNNSIQVNNTSPIIGTTSYENINNLSGNNSFINVNNSTSPQMMISQPPNMIYELNGTSNIVPVINSNGNIIAVPPYTANTSIMEPKKITNDLIDNEQQRLQAKIQKEMLATEERLLEKKAKEEKYNDDDQPPAYY